MIRLYHGDCLDVMKDIPSNSIATIICDLPYGTTANAWDVIIPFDKLWEQYKRILTFNGNVILFANGLFTPKVMVSNLEDYKYRLVWIKRNSTNFVHAKNRPMVRSEDILVFSLGSMGHASQLGDARMTYNPQGIIPCNKTRYDGKTNFNDTLAGKRPSHKESFLVEYTNYPDDVLDDFAEVPPNKKLHTNEKPVKLLEYLIKTYSNDGDTILDNCMGSGSTGVACKNLKRNFIGIELEEKYYEIAKNRIQNAKITKSLL